MPGATAALAPAIQLRNESGVTTPAPPVANPLLLELPQELVGPRVVARCYRDGDGGAVAEAVAESRERLRAAGMPWVDEWDEPDQGAIFVRRCQAKWAAREDFLVGMWDRATSAYLGGCGLHRIVWSVPSVEIGYWVRTRSEGMGFVTEAVGADRCLRVRLAARATRAHPLRRGERAQRRGCPTSRLRARGHASQ